MFFDLLIAAISGGFFTQAVNWFLQRRRSRLDEARIIEDISAKLRDELMEKAQKQAETISALRGVIINLTAVVDQILPRIEGITDEEREFLRESNMKARMAALEA